MTKEFPLPSPEQVDNIILDFGGVLFDIDYHAPIHAFAKLGYSDFNSIYAQSSQMELFDQLETGAISNEDFIRQLAEIAGVSEDQALWAWNTILLGIPKGRIDAVRSLHGKYPTFLLSNTNAIHVAEFERMIDQTMGIDYFRNAFNRIYYSNVMGMKKPHAEIYLRVCKENALNPGRTLFIDDSIQHVRGAAEAGLLAYHLNVEHEDIRELFIDW